MSGCRISRVRDKATGRSITILPTVRREGLAGTIIDGASEIASSYPDSMTGFFIMGVGRDGSYVAGWRIEASAMIGPTLMAALIAETARREVATSAEITSFCVRQGWLSE